MLNGYRLDVNEIDPSNSCFVLHFDMLGDSVSEWAEFNAPPDTTKVISEADILLCD